MSIRSRTGRQRGFTIQELLIVLLVISIAAAFSIPAVHNWLKHYRLGIAAQQVADGLQATKMRAVAKTRKMELLFDISGNRLGPEGSPLGELPPGVTFSRGAAMSAPEPDVATEPAVTFPSASGDGFLRAAAFTGKGLPDADPGETFAVYLSNDAGTRAVTMTSAGNIRIWEWNGTGWE